MLAAVWLSCQRGVQSANHRSETWMNCVREGLIDYLSAGIYLSQLPDTDDDEQHIQD